MSHRIDKQPIFLLSATPWRENSLRIEVFSRDFGKISLLARSARTRGSELRGILVPFVPILVSWFGKEELKTLHRAEWLGGWAQPKNINLFSALYVNELLMKLLPKEDPYPQLFSILQDTLQILCTQQGEVADCLRLFEWNLLTALGLAPDWQYDQAGHAVQEDIHYWVRPEYPVQAIVPTAKLPVNGAMVLGKTLLQLGSGQLNMQSDLGAALRVTRLLLDFRLPNNIHSRRILQQLNGLKQTLVSQTV